MNRLNRFSGRILAGRLLRDQSLVPLNFVGQVLDQQARALRVDLGVLTRGVLGEKLPSLERLSQAIASSDTVYVRAW